MPAGPSKGRSMILRIGAVPVAGVRTKSFNVNGSPIDVTTDDDSGWRKLLDEPGEKTVDMSVSGVTKDDVLLQHGLNNLDRVITLSLVRPDGGSIDGEFFVASYSETGEYNGAVSFEASFQSTGTITYTKT